MFAFITGIFAWLAFHKQSQQVALLLEQNKRDADQRRKAQAARVFLGVPPDGDPVSLYVKNASELPVYNVDIWYFDPGGVPRVTGPDTVGNMIMPGEIRSAERAFQRGDPHNVMLLNIFLTFTDAGSLPWIRTPGGLFRERRHLEPRDEVMDIVGPLPYPSGSSADGTEQA